MKLCELVAALAKENISVTGSGWDSRRGLFFTVDGFSKSGNVSLYEYGANNVLCVARYDEETVVNTVDDLACVAWVWYDSWKDKAPFQFPSQIWCNKFIELGLIRKMTVTKLDKL